MHNSSAKETPQLAPPGAGLPWLELRIARLGFAFLKRRTSRAATTALLWKKHDAILSLACGCEEADAARQILIRRLPGMEDSSRFWSVYMTIEHICIVNTQVAGVIESLGRGIAPPGQASTASVKPKPGAGPAVLDNLRSSCKRLEDVTAGIPDLHTRERFAHPWFGPLDAYDWYYMAAFHMALHQKQIAMIIRDLRH